MDRTNCQNEILKGHSSDNAYLLKKEFSNSVTAGRTDGNAYCKMAYALTSSSDIQQYNFLPYLKFSVDNHFGISVPSSSLSCDKSSIGIERIILGITTKEGLVEVIIPSINDFFLLRNSYRGRILDFPMIKKGDVSQFNAYPFGISQVQAGFSFKAISDTHELNADMGIDHPNAEDLIKSYLQAVDSVVKEYVLFESFFRKGKLGKLLGQSTQYSKLCKESNACLFNELKKVLERGNLEVKLEVRQD